MKAIIELQKRAMDSSTDIVELVRYAYAIAYKLNLQDFVDWCSTELKGYKNSSIPCPEYRCIQGQMVAISADGHKKTIDYSDPKYSDYMQQELLLDSLCVLEGYNSKKDIVMIELDDERKRRVLDFCERDYKESMSRALGIIPEGNSYNIKRMLINSMPSPTPYLSVNNSEIIKIFGVIRQKILDWSLECEKQGILGEEWQFSPKEKQMAQNITYNISSVQNMANHNTDTTINQTAQNMSVTKGDFQSLANFLNDRGISAPDIQGLKEIIDVESNLVTEGMENSKLQSWIGKIAIGGSLVAKGVAVETIVEGIKYYLGF